MILLSGWVSASSGVMSPWLHVRVVVREGLQPRRGGIEIASAIAAPCDVGVLGLYPGEHNRGAHADGVEVIDDVLVDGFVGVGDGLPEQ